METKIHNLRINLDWEILNSINQLDKIDYSWLEITKKEVKTLKQLKSIATVQSVGASTRIEGSKMKDDEVEEFLKVIDITRLEDRDAQEVAGYFDVLELINESFETIEINESAIKNLHNQLLKYCTKDKWHQGKYKQHSNAVEANFADRTRQIIFQTTPPGFETEDAMRILIEWYQQDSVTHPLVKAALFSYEFVSIHPFQDGNGRMSRLLLNLLLLQNGYAWIKYLSLEHEIEKRKTEYYRVLRGCQSQRPNENITEWIKFIFEIVKKTSGDLLEKLTMTETRSKLSSNEKSLLIYISAHPECKSGEMAEALKIPNPTVKRILMQMVNKNLIERHGAGPGTNYTVK